jgi:serine/threonine protein kinase/tetratricopeptide (TPR) repeat protein
MNPERWARIEGLFQAALERSPGERAVFLKEACADDPALRQEVESLIASHEQAGPFLAASAFAAAGQLLAENEDQPMPEQRLGSYQLVREIGRGGMGAIYLATRADDEYQKQVAIKLVKRGMDTDSIIRRFRNERQILANLDHPNIARLLDGGTTADGRPYFVMDYVEGLPIDVYCDTRQLSTTERLQLFRTVCSAVHYAHEHHIIHRDLKPSNILVTAEGVLKLLDFGIAKVLDPERVAQTVDATGALRLLTPEYASPEQVRGEPVTPASDVYSLGVLLYELLTGRRPHRVHAPTPLEIERMVGETEPEKPSAVINRIAERSSADGRTPTPESVSELRHTRPKALRRRLAGDLDNLVLMALRKEPERRYPSVAAFSEDIRRHLEGQPVTARRDTFAYRSVKFIHRNKAGVLQTTLVGMALLVLIGIGRYPRIWHGEQGALAVQEDAAREISEKLRLGVEEKRQLSKRYTENTEAYRLYLMGRYYWSHKRTDARCQKAIEYFQQALDKDPKYALAYTGIADTYLLLGAFGYRPPWASFPYAKEAATRALALDERLAEAHNSMGAVKVFHWDLSGAEREFQQAIALNPEYANAHDWYAQLLSNLGRHEAAIAEKKRAQALEPLAPYISPAWNYFMARQYDRAIEESRKMIEKNKNLEIDPTFGGGYYMLGLANEQKGQYEEAIGAFQKALALGRGSPRTVAVLAHAYAVAGRKTAARQRLAEAKELSKTVYMPYYIAAVHAALGEKDQAWEWLDRAYKDHDGTLVWLKVDPWFDPLRSDPRFADLVRRVGLPP